MGNCCAVWRRILTVPITVYRSLKFLLQVLDTMSSPPTIPLYSGRYPNGYGPPFNGIEPHEPLDFRKVESQRSRGQISPMAVTLPTDDARSSVCSSVWLIETLGLAALLPAGSGSQRRMATGGK
ncbi:hypothetical protein pipiens_017113 [Culex pipiens pipiens]|uniref:Uncharacterized protein n=1 Tax=Culex pipiens pipiens TaxID=38569 RepID=A0ABD1CI31_CULPP